LKEPGLPSDVSSVINVGILMIRNHIRKEEEGEEVKGRKHSYFFQRPTKVIGKDDAENKRKTKLRLFSFSCRGFKMRPHRLPKRARMHTVIADRSIHAHYGGLSGGKIPICVFNGAKVEIAVGASSWSILSGSAPMVKCLFRIGIRCTV
jgi:hypothetical protein